MSEKFLILFGIFAIGILIYLVYSNYYNKKHSEIEFFSKTDVLNNAELNIYKELQPFLNNNDLVIFPHLKSSNIATVNKKLTTTLYFEKQEKLKSITFDFTVCNKDDLSIICLIDTNLKKSKNEKFIYPIIKSNNPDEITTEIQKMLKEKAEI